MQHGCAMKKNKCMYATLAVFLNEWSCLYATLAFDVVFADLNDNLAESRLNYISPSKM
jgi:hypothetical protein